MEKESFKKSEPVFFDRFSKWALKDYLSGQTDPFEKAKIHLTFNLSVLNFILVVVLYARVIITRQYFSVVNISAILIEILIVLAILKYKRNVKLAAILYSVFIFTNISIGVLFNKDSLSPFNILFSGSVVLFAYFTLGKKAGTIFMVASMIVWLVYVRFFMYDNLHNEIIYTVANPSITLILSFSMVSYTIFQFVNIRSYAEYKIKKNNTELKIAKEIAEQALQIQEQFLANTSHEVRTPINGIIGMTRQLTETPITEEQREYLNAIKESSNNLLHVVNDILDITKIRANKITLEKTEFRLNELLKTLQLTLQYKAKEKNIYFKVLIDKDIPPVLIGDPVRLNQILLNLAGNAVKFTEQGGVTISVQKIASENESVQLEFSVSDTGIGISEDKLEYVFESFAQAEIHTTRKYGGTGLGLSIAKSLVEQQNGKIKASSKLNEGSVFSFCLYFAVGESTWNGTNNQLTEDINSNADLSGMNVLLVDDNKINQHVVLFDLSKWKVNVTVTDNAKSAFEQLLKNKYDIILMDISMPEMNGLEASQYIRTNMPEPIKNVPIIAMTASALAGEKEKCIDAGMNDYISKPFDPITLHAKIVKWCKKKEAKQAILNNEKIAAQKQKLTDLSMAIEHSNGNTDYIKTIIDIYSRTIPQDLQKLNNGLEEFDREVIASMCHKMKSSVAYVGAASIVKLFTKIETDNSQQKDKEHLKQLIDKVNTLCLASIEELKQEKLLLESSMDIHQSLV